MNNRRPGWNPSRLRYSCFQLPLQTGAELPIARRALHIPHRSELRIRHVRNRVRIVVTIEQVIELDAQREPELVFRTEGRVLHQRDVFVRITESPQRAYDLGPGAKSAIGRLAEVRALEILRMAVDAELSAVELA